MGMKDATDGDLVRRTRLGEAAAFAELCRRHGSRARTLARGVLSADAEAEDGVQDALLAAFEGLARLREPERFGGWLYAITVNLARMRVRARHPDGALAPPAAAPTPEEAVEQTERARLVRWALGTLSDGEQRVVLLHYFGGHGCAEIGAMLGLTERAVRVRLHRARGRLRSSSSSCDRRRPRKWWRWRSRRCSCERPARRRPATRRCASCSCASATETGGCRSGSGVPTATRSPFGSPSSRRRGRSPST